MKLLLSFTIIASQAIQSFAALDPDALTRQYFGNDSAWYRDRIPLFESSNTDITKIYYYRWNIFRAHQRDLGTSGFISTEFLDDVEWQTSPWATLNDATAFHLLEGRWCRDRRFKDDYATFIYSPNSNTRQFSEAMADAVWKDYLVDGDASLATSLLASMEEVFEAWSDSFDDSKGLYWVEPLRDATEYTISSIDASGGKDGFRGGDAFRPSINSYQYSNAKAIASIASLKGGLQGVVDKYNQSAADIKDRVQNSLWNSTFEHFIDRFHVNNTEVRYWDPIRGRELVGMVPWAHDLPDDNTEYAQAWKHILSTKELAGPHGLRTVEPSYEYYMRQYRFEGSQPECQWNGPVWPYQTTQVLTGLANLLDHYPKSTSAGLITKADYTRLLIQYAQLHFNPERDGIMDLEENYYPDTGAPVVGLTRSLHYFHSGFIDNVISGFVGIRPHADDVLEVNPLAEAGEISYFRADRIPYHGHDIAVQWDATGSRYGTAGLVVEVDGSVVGSSPNLERLTVSISRNTPSAIKRPLAKSVQLQRDSDFPKGSASVTDADEEKLHDAIDGRVWFFPEIEVVNGWDTPVGDDTELWYQVDFGNDTETQTAELAFFANGEQGFDVPKEYRIQVNTGSWQDVGGAKYGPIVANGITTVNWDLASANKIRIVFTPKLGQKARLVEFKIF